VAIAVAGLLERERDLALIAERVERATSGRGSAVMVEGPAGIGKTSLLEAARASAGDGLGVVRARGGELERDLPYGIVRQLFGPLVERLDRRESDELFSGAAALARRALDPAAEAGADPGPIREALFNLALRLSRRGRLLIVVDDLHWSDEPSLLWVLHLVRRIEDWPIVVLLARRIDEPGQGSTLDRIASEITVERVEPAPLTRAAVVDLVHRTLGDGAGGIAPEEWHELTGGNPFLLRQLLDEVDARADAADLDVHALAPAGLTQWVRQRLARLPGAAREFARAMSVLERAAKLDDPARLTGLGDSAAAADAADALVAAGILADGAPLEFVHPLVRQTVYLDLTGSERAVRHEAAARLLAERGRVEEAAAHLLASRRAPELWGVDLLRRAAATAGARGAPGVAVRQLVCALHSPSLGSLRTAVLGELGLAELRTLDPAGLDHLREAIDATADAAEAARLAVPTARALTALWRHQEAVDLIEPILARLPEDQAPLRRALEGELIATASADTQTLPIAGERLAEMLARAGSAPESDPVQWGIAAMAGAAAGVDRMRNVEIARAAIAGGRIGEAYASALPYSSIVLVWAGEVDAAEAAWEAALASATRAGSTLEAALARGYLAICANQRGECVRAESLAGAALDAVAQAGVPAGPYPLAPLADALVARGAPGAALSMLERHVDARTDRSVSFPLVLFGRGRARIAAGDPGGVDEVLEAGRRFVAQGAPSPAIAPWRSVAALALASGGDLARAGELVAEELELARAFGAPIAIGVALTAAAAIGDREPHRALETANDAVSTLEPTAARGALAEALVCEGRTLHALGRAAAARAPLRNALDIAHRLGAEPIAERARALLVAAGGRPRRPALSGPAALTPREEHVARLAAGGMASREIADELVISVRTVDLHLSNAYRKLGVDGRAGLRTALES
jgi:DNA-binding CsgD family transcriptional regulator